MAHSKQPMTRRPISLTIIGIVAFIAVAAGLLEGFLNYFNADILGENQNLPLNADGEQLSTSDIQTYGIYGILSSILMLFGSLLMFFFNKVGYALFIIGVIAAIVGGYTVFGDFYSLWTFIIRVFAGLFLVILFAFTLKHME